MYVMSVIFRYDRNGIEIYYVRHLSKAIRVYCLWKLKKARRIFIKILLWCGYVNDGTYKPQEICCWKNLLFALRETELIV